ncbi:MAG: sigma-70 family RNA polymerase sigma factor [Planctomycetes bacterium]|nr:sigma-70 family RNA polymerase sigma factor [Planctomycetota bacterium]
MQTDEGLVDEFKRTGSRQALDELTDRHVAKVRAMVSEMVLDRSLVDDLTQEVFLRAYRGLAGFQGRAQFSTWLYRVTMNTVHGYLDRVRRSPVAFHAELPETPAASDQQPAQLAVQTELSSRIEAAVASLSPPLRAAIVLTTLQGMGASEAAKIEGCNLATMYWRIHAARKALKRHLAEYMQP